MIIATTIMLIVFLLVIWLIFVPVEIKVDTSHGLYEIRQSGTIKVSFHPGQQQLMRLHVLGIPINLSGKEVSANKAPESGKKKTKKRFINKSTGSWLFLLKGVRKAIRCRRLILNADFEDVVLGAQLFPLVSIWNTDSFQVNINFQKRYYLNLWIQVRIHQICWTFVRFFLTKR